MSYRDLLTMTVYFHTDVENLAVLDIDYSLGCRCWFVQCCPNSLASVTLSVWLLRCMLDVLTITQVLCVHRHSYYNNNYTKTEGDNSLFMCIYALYSVAKKWFMGSADDLLWADWCHHCWSAHRLHQAVQRDHSGHSSHGNSLPHLVYGSEMC